MYYRVQKLPIESVVAPAPDEIIRISTAEDSCGAAALVASAGDELLLSVSKSISHLLRPITPNYTSAKNISYLLRPITPNYTSAKTYDLNLKT